MQRKGMRELRKNSRQGVSLVIVLCVSAFFVAFAAAILYTAGLLTSQSTGRLKEERSYLLAQSFAEALDKELSDKDTSFFEFVNRFLDGNQYAEDTLRRTEEAIAEALNEVKQSRSHFRSVTSAVNRSTEQIVPDLDEE